MTIAPPSHRGLSTAQGLCAGAFALFAIACGEAADTPATDGAPLRPDLVLVTVDTLRPDRLACYGGTPDVGARLCSLADEGIRYVDDRLASFVSFLRSTGVRDESLLIVLSDHGEEFAEHGGYLHWKLFYQPNPRDGRWSWVSRVGSGRSTNKPV